MNDWLLISGFRRLRESSLPLFPWIILATDALMKNYVYLSFTCEPDKLM
ncbi:MAG: hypothetical protein RIC06_03470 [Cyclobacteriaceae bacterium]